MSDLQAVWDLQTLKLQTQGCTKPALHLTSHDLVCYVIWPVLLTRIYRWSSWSVTPPAHQTHICLISAQHFLWYFVLQPGDLSVNILASWHSWLGRVWQMCPIVLCCVTVQCFHSSTPQSIPSCAADCLYTRAVELTVCKPDLWSWLSVHQRLLCGQTGILRVHVSHKPYSVGPLN